jgi:hypothetical protein
MGTGGTDWADQDPITLARMNQKTNYIGPSAPTTTYAGMHWFDTANNKVYERNAANGAWLQVYPVVIAGLITQTEVDFGNLNYVIITDANVTATSKITAQLAYDQPTAKDLDEVEMDEIEVICGQCATGSFSMVITSLTGSLYGKFKINYMIG